MNLEYYYPIRRMIFIVITLCNSGCSLIWNQCPRTSQFSLRRKAFCNSSAEIYSCLFDENKDNFIELCIDRVYYQTPGYKYVIRGGLDSEACDLSRYQPFRFSTSENTDCVFYKSKCNEDGQVITNIGSTVEDVFCRCDYTKGYTYVNHTSNMCYCKPSVEDCSCYIKPCAENYIMSPDYECTHQDAWINNKFSCSTLPAKEFTLIKTTQGPDISIAGKNKKDYCTTRNILVIMIIAVVICFAVTNTIWISIVYSSTKLTKENYINGITL